MKTRIRNGVLSFFLITLTLIFVIIIGENADKTGPAIVIGIVFGTAASVVTGLWIAVLTKGNVTVNKVTHQHLHVYEKSGNTVTAVTTTSKTGKELVTDESKENNKVSRRK